MVKFFIDKEKLEKYSNSIFIYALGGGFGNIARIAGESLIKTYKAERIGRIISYAFPNVFYVNKNGRIKNIYELKLYGFEESGEKFLVLYGIQPGILDDPGLTLYEQYTLTYYTLKKLKKINIKEVVTLGGVAMELEPEDPKVFLFYNKYFKKESILNKYSDLKFLSNTNVSGMAGMFIIVAEYMKIPGYGLLAETYSTNQLPGFLGAAKVLEYLSGLYNFKVSLDKLKEEGKKLREDIKNRLDDLKKSMQKKGPETSSYFG